MDHSNCVCFLSLAGWNGSDVVCEGTSLDRAVLRLKMKSPFKKVNNVLRVRLLNTRVASNRSDLAVTAHRPAVGNKTSMVREHLLCERQDGGQQLVKITLLTLVVALRE